MKIFPLGFFFCHDFFYVDQEHVFSQLIELLPAEFGHGLVLGDIGLGQGFFAVVARLRKIHRQLGLKDRLPSMSDEEQLGLLAGDGMLVKRPLLIQDNGRVLVGFKEKEWEDALS